MRRPWIARSSTFAFRLTARLFLAFFFSVGCLLGSAFAQEPEDSPSPEPIFITDLLKIQQLGSVAVSPGSREVVYTVTSIVDADPAADRDSLVYRTHLYLVDAAGTWAPRQLTRGDASATDPAWHPDGNRIAFVRRVDGTPQVFVLPLLGGEAIQITDFGSGASNPRWSPDGSRILFSSSLTAEELADRIGHGPSWPLERPGRSWSDADDVRPDINGSVAEVRAWLEENAEEGSPRVFHRLDFHGEHDLEDRTEFGHYFVIQVDTMAEPVMITDGFNDFDGAEWLPDGERVVVSGTVQDQSHPDRTIDSHLYTAQADGSGLSPLLEMDGYSLSSPAPSPDGRQVVFLARDESDRGYAQGELGILPLEGGSDAQLLTLDFDRSVSDPAWSKDGWYVYFTAASNGGVPLYRLHPFASSAPAPTTADAPQADTSDAIQTDTATVAPSSAAADTTIADAVVDSVAATAADTQPAGPTFQIERLTSFERGVLSYSPGRATLFFVGTSVENPYELYAANLQFTSESRITSHNAEWLEHKILSYPERHTLTRDGREIEYWIMRPTAFDPTRSYPLLLQIHGGPSAMWGPGEATMWHEFQFFAAKGYGIVFANPRGSGGYGYDFKRANYQDWGTGPAQDVLAAASEAAALPWVDADRQVVTGGSYAGYLTAWIVAHDQRFQAAAAQRGVYDLDTFLGEGKAWRLVPLHFGGYPWDTEPVDTTGAPAPPVAQAAPVTRPDSTAASGPLTLRDAAEATDSLDAGDTVTAPVDAVAEQADTVTAPVDAVVLQADTITTQANPTRTASVATPAAALSPAEVLALNSPITFVDQISTPLLIIHADNDLRTGVIQSEMLYKSLKILNRPVEYVRYPNAGHDLSRTGDPKQRMDRILRIYEFFERFIR